MARLILDTTVLVDAERTGSARLEAMVEDEDEVAVAAISVAELRVGVELAGAKRRPARQAFLAELLEALSVEDYDLEVAEAHAALLAHTQRRGEPRGAHDLIIAATARARNREVISSDARAFSELPAVRVRRASG